MSKKAEWRLERIGKNKGKEKKKTKKKTEKYQLKASESQQFIQGHFPLP